jgi:transcriptional regulator with XRE-family HTH domain
MGQKKLTHQREVAKILFMQGLTQAEIAEKLGVSKNSVNKWAKDGHWETVQKNLIVSKSEQLSELYEELAELNSVIKSREEGQRYPTTKEADTRRKIIKDISDLETKYNIGQTTIIARDFTMFSKEIDHEFAARAVDMFDLFINDQIQKQKWQKGA